MINASVCRGEIPLRSPADEPHSEEALDGLVNMAEDKDPREEALWEYANEKVRACGCYREESGTVGVYLAVWVWERREERLRGAETGAVSALNRQADALVVCACACAWRAAARNVAADDGGPLPGASVQPGGGEPSRLCFAVLAPFAHTAQGKAATSRCTAPDVMPRVHSTSCNTSVAPAPMEPSAWTH